ncbi:hypothetical protein J5N97_028899 [Dioscorea zingiberensis]|uniref:Protein kinase domain-containing protein n=1 Tax=Dioscorea zingiberensis TaxID=325984 RepID=A0A9D5C0D2_9LILI|nr:hypothetical protein J5N97_028899 [Dioscorea zingiberensis]
MGSLAVASWRLPVSAAEKEDRWSSVGDVLRRDREFIGERIRSVAAPLAPLKDRLSKSLEDLFWLRNLEDRRAVRATRPPSSLPKLSYPPGLSGVDLLMADIGALRVYANYLHNVSKIWSMPLPEEYDPQNVADYFSCRPHVLVLRILEVFSSVGLAAIKLRSLQSFKLNKKGIENNGSMDMSKHYIGQLLKESMLSLGPTFIKVGQSLSTRPDIIGPEISKELSELHDKVPPFPREVAMKIIEEEMGRPINNIFSYISEEPVAAASFGQVYQGRTVDGSTVAIKVQRPNLLPVVLRDIYILRLGLDFLRKVARRKSDICLYADELGKGLVGELDYTLEAANASKFLEAHSHYSFISVPKVFGNLTRKRILTMEWVIGENPTELLLLSSASAQGKNVHSKMQEMEAKTHLLDLVNKGVEASLVQLLETGLLHADPHPGNLRYTPDGRIGFLDFGLLCRMEKKHQLAMLASIVHIVNGDWGALVYDLVEMDVVRPGVNLRMVTMDLEEALGGVVFQDGIPDIKFSKVLGKIWSIALKYHFKMPPYYTLVLRSLASLEGLALAADQNFKTFQAAYPYVIQKLLQDNSANSRRILYSVVFNKRREFHWQKIMLFLRIGLTREGKSGFSFLGREKSLRYGSTFEVANLILKLLPSKDGIVLRRLLMTADPASLVRTMVSKDAAFFRKHMSRALADVIFLWMTEVFRAGKVNEPSKITHGIASLKMQQDRDSKIETVVPSAASGLALLTVLRDRRMKVIFFKVLDSIRSDPILMLRLCWSSLTVLVTASVLALHQSLVYWSEAWLTSVAYVPKRFAISVR